MEQTKANSIFIFSRTDVEALNGSGSTSSGGWLVYKSIYRIKITESRGIPWLSEFRILFSGQLRTYFNSCSKSWKRSELKKSSMLMPSPSQSFLTVDTVALWFLPLTILFTVDWVTPLMLLSLLTEIFFSLQSSKIRSLTASPISMGITSFLYR